MANKNSKRVVTYTEEQVASMVNLYGAATTDEGRAEAVKTLAVNLGKSEASVRAKLVNLGVYVKAERKTKDGKAIESKAEVVEQIAELCDMDSEFFDSLEKANKAVLVVLRSKLENFADMVMEAQASDS